MRVLATDIGYGWTKYVFDDGGGCKKFPTAVRRLPQEVEFEISAALEWQDGKYLVGEKAVLLPKGEFISPFSQGFLENFSPLIILEILRREKKEREDDTLVVCTSLSIADYKKKKEKVINSLKRITANGTIIETEPFVFPQGVGIWHDVKDAIDSDAVFIIDIGEKTVDFVYLLDGEIIMADCWQNDGLHKCLTTIMREFGLTKQQALSVLKNGFYLKQGKKQHLDKTKAAKSFVSDLFKRIELSFSEILEAARPVVAGGGANLISDSLKEEYGIVIPKEPEFSNVRGYLKILTGGR